MMNAISYVISGLIVGALACFFYPGPVRPGFLIAVALGIGGSLLAGFITSRGQQGFHRAGFLASLLGAMVLIFAGRNLFHLF